MRAPPFIFAAVFLSVVLSNWVHAEEYITSQEAGTATLTRPSTSATNDELARKAQNPISYLTSALVENNFNFGYGLSNGLQYIGNLEEFYPLKVADDVNLIQRLIIPVITQPEVVPGQGSHGGLGDIQYQAYISSVNSSGLIFGAGPMVSTPSAYPHELGSGKWSLGPTLALTLVKGDFVGGVQGYQLWSISNYNDRPDVSLMQLQPFLNVNFSNGWYLASSPVIVANWKETDGNRWTVPVGGGGGKVFRIGKLPIKTELQVFDFIRSPEQGPVWSTRLQIQFLFPEEKQLKESFQEM